ncbi:MAG: beta-galactosidase [Kosmotogales bacterium]|nr:beta-galactosidase [Kosmotogales bacterium]
MFSDDFYFGASMSGFQVEMGNPKYVDKNTDWYHWATSKAIIDQGLVSGDNPTDGPDYFSNYELCHDLAKECGMKMLRVGIEWSRIFPQETFDIKDINELKEMADDKVISLYRKILEDMKRKDISTMVTLSHFTLPIWLNDPVKMKIEKDFSRSGWYDERSIDEFNKFVMIIGEELKDLVDYWVTENEPNISIMGLKFDKSGFPPCLNSEEMYNKALINESRAHEKAYKTLKGITEKPVGVVLALECQTGEWDLVKKIQKEYVEPLVDLFEPFDFLGVNYYSRYYAEMVNGELKKIKGFGQDSVSNSFTADNRPTSDMGWEIYPEGLFNMIKMLHYKYKKPFFITENGIADDFDCYRPYYLVGHLYAIERLIEDGVDLRGYLHWSLIDNFEWPEGFDKKFGLIHCNYSDKSFTPRPSYYIYSKIINEKSTKNFKNFLRFPYEIWDDRKIIREN